MPKDTCDSCSASVSTTGKLYMCGMCLNSWYCGREHQVGAWPAHRAVCIPRDDKDAVAIYAKGEIEARDAYFASSPEDQWAMAACKNRLEEFVAVNPWPSRTNVLHYIERGADHVFDFGNSQLYDHELARRLYEAAALEPEAECGEQRLVGYLLEKLGGMEAMMYHFYLVQHMLCGAEVWPKKGEMNGHDVSEYVKCLEIAWDGIGEWYV